MLIHYIQIKKSLDDVNTKVLNFDFVVNFEIKDGEIEKLGEQDYVKCNLISYRSFNKEGKEQEWVIRDCYIHLE